MAQLMPILLFALALFALFALLLFILEVDCEPTLSTVVNKEVLKGFASAVLLPVERISKLYGL